MLVYIVLEIIPILLGTTTVTTYEELRFVGSTIESAHKYRSEHDYYDSTIRIKEVDAL